VRFAFGFVAAGGSLGFPQTFCSWLADSGVGKTQFDIE